MFRERERATVSGDYEAVAYSPSHWCDCRCWEWDVRRYTIRLAIGSEWAFRRVLDDLRWDAGIDTLSVEWAAGEGVARVECFGDVGVVLDALKAAGQEPAALGVARD
jgi:hypothetical protein